MAAQAGANRNRRSRFRQAETFLFWEDKAMYELWVNMGDGRPWRQFFYEMRDTKKMAEKIKAVLQEGGTIQLRKC